MRKGASYEFAFVVAPFVFERTKPRDARKKVILFFVRFVVFPFISQTRRPGSGLGAVQARTHRYKEGGRAGRCSGESENSG